MLKMNLYKIDHLFSSRIDELHGPPGHWQVSNPGDLVVLRLAVLRFVSGADDKRRGWLRCLLRQANYSAGTRAGA
jgi:hypothetical protein